MSTIRVAHDVPRDDLLLGFVRVDGVVVGPADDALTAAIDAEVARRRSEGLSAAEDTRRKAARDVLRNGRYKPTGRGKPASEYLLRAASEDTFPRVNGPVDALNLASLAHVVPISVWDPDRAGGDRFAFRLGAEGERYVFNSVGQRLELHDLVCGCAVIGDESQPIVTPVKDGMATKVVDETRRLVGCVYFPRQAGGAAGLASAIDDLRRWLVTCGPTCEATTVVLEPGASASL